MNTKTEKTKTAAQIRAARRRRRIRAAIWRVRYPLAFGVIIPAVAGFAALASGVADGKEIHIAAAYGALQIVLAAFIDKFAR